jgi:hypothetical protein
MIPKKNGGDFDIGVFYQKGIELGLCPNQCDEITLDQWGRLCDAPSSSNDPNTIDLGNATEKDLEKFTSHF